MSKKDFYETLGVEKSATQDEIRSAYKKLAMKYHPDRNPDDKEKCEAKLKEINEAYDTLQDKQKRANYDQFGSTDGSAGFSGFGGFGGKASGSGGFGGFEDIFNDINQMFNRGGGGGARRSNQNGAQKGSDLRYTLKITLLDVFNGVKKKVTFRALGKCEECAGKGGEGMVDCSECGGRGSVRYQQGFFIVENTCPKCQGIGRIIKNPCKKCRGTGRTEKEFNVEVDVPKGVAEGDNIKVAGHGEAGVRGGSAGDLFVVIKIEKHELFTREGNNLYCEVPIKFTKAILGGNIDIPMVNGEMYNLKISSGIQNGDKIRIPGKGLPRYNSTIMGDMYVIAKIETPVNLNNDQKKIIEEFESSIKEEEHNPASWNFFKKIADLFK